jgi:hypothetical protein
MFAMDMFAPLPEKGDIRRQLLSMNAMCPSLCVATCRNDKHSHTLSSVAPRGTVDQGS